jgi:hypothetical protein
MKHSLFDVSNLQFRIHTFVFLGQRFTYFFNLTALHYNDNSNQEMEN